MAGSTSETTLAPEVASSLVSEKSPTETPPSPSGESQEENNSRQNSDQTTTDTTPSRYRSVTLKTPELMHGATTGEGMRFRGGKEYPGQKMEVTIGSETVEKYRNFVETYVNNLCALSDPDTANLDLNRILDMTGYDKMVFNLLTTEVRN